MHTKISTAKPILIQLPYGAATPMLGEILVDPKVKRNPSDVIGITGASRFSTQDIA